MARSLPGVTCWASAELGYSEVPAPPGTLPQEVRPQGGLGALTSAQVCLLERRPAEQNGWGGLRPRTTSERPAV